MADDAADAMPDADSIGRLGRAVAVTLIAATQRPTQKAMGQGAVRSQMDLRIAFRVRERKDVDLILGQGMLAAGWHAHTLNAPGKFLISSPEHDTPRRARAYLATDEVVADTAAYYGSRGPALDEVSRLAIEARHTIVSVPPPADPGGDELNPPADCHDRTTGADGRETRENAPDAILWAALSLAPDAGTTVPDLMTAAGMSRPWVYQRLRELADRGQVTQVSRGRWRAVNGDNE